MHLTQSTFGRHGSFQLRYGWITKGIQAIQNKQDSQKLADVFTSDNATVNLGVGKNMVAAIRYWLVATKIINNTEITEFGHFLKEQDCYLEDEATLWLLHLQLAQNKELSTSIYWLFNHFHKVSFTADEAFNALILFIANSKIQVSHNTIRTDISVMLRMYAPHRTNKTQIESMLESPLSLLNLIKHHDGKYHFVQSSQIQIPVEMIAYAINEYFVDEQIIPVKELMYGDKLALGRILRISEDSLVTYLEKLVSKYPKNYQLREDAGIFQLHVLHKVRELEYLENYYGSG